ncbi:MAG: proton-conducting transporter membrane subunit, partial [Pirellulales bacterium]
MSYQQLIENLFSDTAMSVKFFLPELTLCCTILLMLLARLFRWGRALGSFVFATAGAIVALYYAAPWLLLESGDMVQRTELFTGMLVYDSFTVFFRGLLLFFLILFCVLSQLTGIPDKEDSGDYYTLVLGSVLGMMLMVSANHLLIIFLAVEMASVPSYVLAGMLKGRRKASEAALKYSIYGAGTAGVMLYGISLVAGITGSAHLPTVAVRLSELLSGPAMGSAAIVLALGSLMIAVGLAFKLSAVPFHFWCPDVFEGASAEVNAFLSVASKAAALALLVRVAIGVGYVPEATQQRLAQASAVAEELAERPAALMDAAPMNAAPMEQAMPPADALESAAPTAVTEPTAI